MHPVFPPEIVRIIALNNVIVYVKLRECCKHYSQLLPINTTHQFHLKPTLVRDPVTRIIRARQAITYILAGRYIIKRIRITQHMYHIVVYLNLQKILDLQPTQLKHESNDWLYPNTIYRIETWYAVIHKYYERKGDGLICCLIYTYNKQSGDMRWLMWYNNSYHELQLDATGKILSDMQSTTIREYYPPHILPYGIEHQE